MNSLQLVLSGSDKRNRAGSPQNSILRSQILVLQEQLLVYKAGQVRQQAYPLGFFHLEWP
jgi:hypothetical protein